MSLHVAFDMDGVFADFSSAYHDVETRLFGPGVSTAAGQPEDERGRFSSTGASMRRHIKRHYRRRAAIWDTIRDTPDFWVTLKPLREDAIGRLHRLAIEHRWEVFFITQRPSTLGETVQRQTQRWLREHGFDLPSVLVTPGSRSAAASLLSLDYYVDDSAINCVDFTADTGARPILVVDSGNMTALTSARRLGIATADHVDIALDILEQASTAHEQPGMLQHLAQLVGWK